MDSDFKESSYKDEGSISERPNYQEAFNDPNLNGFTRSQHSLLQLINQDKKFSDELGSFLSSNNRKACGTDYNIVAVFGSQSTGKSTLLNRLFGTRFAVMDQSVARHQTTKGIWLSEANNLNNLSAGESRDNPSKWPTFVLDVEGTDGRERGEDQEFERRSALFSLTAAQVIIINLWENSIGLYNGANMGLLKTVFEVNLQLFHEGKSHDAASESSQHPKTLLLFVIRDYIGTTPMESHKKVLLDSLKSIWEEISATSNDSDGKTAPTKLTSMEQLFDFDFHALPHKVLQADMFEKESNQLRSRFFSDGQSLFKPEYHRQIPADGLPIYLKQIWDTITTSADLDLPTQKQLLAQYRCDEIIKACWEWFENELKSKVEKVLESENQIVDGFGNMISEMNSHAISTFSEQASRYHKDVVDRKKTELSERLFQRIRSVFALQLKKIKRRSLEIFKKHISSLSVANLQNFSMTPSKNVDFAKRLLEAQSLAKEFFRRKLEESLPQEMSFKIKDEISAFESELYELVYKARQAELEKVGKKLFKASQNSLVESISGLMSECPRDLWPRIYRDILDSCHKYSRSLVLKANALQATSDEILERTRELRENLWDSAKSRIKEELSDNLLSIKIKEKFEKLFKEDDQGVPRIVSKEEEKDGVFLRAKDEAEELILLLSKFRLPNRHSLAKDSEKDDDPSKNEDSLEENENVFNDVDDEISSSPSPAPRRNRRHSLKITEDLDEGVLEDNVEAHVLDLIFADEDYDEDANAIILLSPSKQRSMKERLKKDADAVFLEVKRGASNSLSEVPKSMWLLLLVLGFNELSSLFSYLISNPIMFFVLLCLFAMLWMLYQSGLLFPTLKVAMRTVQPTTQAFLNSVGPMLDGLRGTIAESLKQVSEKLEDKGYETPPSTPLKKKT